MTNLFEQVINDLTGSCRTLSEVLETYGAEHLENDKSFCSALDDRIFCCNWCNWWSEVSEMSDEEDWVCEECA